jgi:hypothetical protein
MKLRELHKVVKGYDKEINDLTEERRKLVDAGAGPEADGRMEEIDRELERLEAERHVYRLQTIDVRAKTYRWHR